MKILNYGAGAVGLGIDSCLLKSGAVVDIIGRRNTVSALKRTGLKRAGIFGDYSASPKDFAAYTSLDEIPARAYDFILVSTKSFDSGQAAKDISSHPSLYTRDTKIILCQNGWGNAEIFCAFLPKGQVYNARVITGFTRPNPNEVMITVHADSVQVGSLFHSRLDDIEKLCNLISRGDLPCRTTQDIGKDLWAKMLYICALNPLGAILDVPYGVLGEHEATRSIMKDIVEETYEVMKATGHETYWPTPKEYLEMFYEKFLPPTARHRSSTLQSLKAKKKTEIDALNGMVVKLARQFTIDVPVNEGIYKIIKSIDRSPAVPDDGGRSSPGS